MSRVKWNTIIWQARIKITQIPEVIDTEIVWDYDKKKELPIKRSFLINPLGDGTVYGLELSLKQEFSWTFFISKDTQEKAFVSGLSFLHHLETLYPGLTAEFTVIQARTLNIHENSELHELVLPTRPLEVKIIEKILHLFKKEKIGDITFYFFWQRDDSIERGCSRYNGEFSYFFKLKIMMRYDPHPVSDDIKLFCDAVLKSYLSYLINNIFSLFKSNASFESRDWKNWFNIITSKVMVNNDPPILTGRFYEFIRHEIADDKRFCFVHPAVIDFTFPANALIRTANVLKLRNYQYKNASIFNKNSIWIGQVISNGIVESNNDLIPISHFGKSTFIGGQMGTGKTRLLTQISREFYKKAPDVGILYLNVGKTNQEHLYQHDSVIKYGDPEFNVPYFVEGENSSSSIEQTATYLTASLGLRDPVPKLLKNVMESFIRVNHELPASIRTLFKGLQKWYHVHQYDSKFQKRILTAIDNRVISLVSDGVFEKCMRRRMSNDSTLILPQWFLDWRNGKKVLLDISMCNEYVKLMLSSAIFQMTRALTPDVNELSHVIVIDEAQALLGKSMNLFSNSDIFIAKEELGKIFAILLGEFRSKGLCFIISSVDPSSLVSCVTDLPSLKILFRMGANSIQRFHLLAEDHKFLMLLKNRHALVLNGNNSERYAIKTITIETKKFLTMKERAC